MDSAKNISQDKGPKIFKLLQYVNYWHMFHFNHSKGSSNGESKPKLYDNRTFSG